MPLLRGALRTAAPPCISGRTSYLRVRLAFHPYPHVIPQFCNTGGFGPRRGLTPASPCAWIAHPVSGLVTATPIQRSRPLQTRFRSGSTALPPLNLPGAQPYGRLRRCRHQLVGSFYKRHAVRLRSSGRPLERHVLRLLVGVGFQRLFHPPRGVLFTFPSRYSFPIGGQGVLSLGGWSPLLPTGFPVSRGTQAAQLAPRLPRPVRGSHPSTASLPSNFP